VIDAVQKAFEDLKQKGVLYGFERKNVTGLEKLLDVVFTIWPSFDFVKEVKAANRRRSDGAQKLSQVGLNGGLRRNAVGTTGGRGRFDGALSSFPQPSRQVRLALKQEWVGSGGSPSRRLLGRFKLACVRRNR
jgi:hypothetical protein